MEFDTCPLGSTPVTGALRRARVRVNERGTGPSGVLERARSASSGGPREAGSEPSPAVTLLC